jgi:hypothetical protein
VPVHHSVVCFTWHNRENLFALMVKAIGGLPWLSAWA